MCDLHQFLLLLIMKIEGRITYARYVIKLRDAIRPLWQLNDTLPTSCTESWKNHTQCTQHTVHTTHSAHNTQCTQHTVHTTHSAHNTQCTQHTVHTTHSAHNTQCTQHTVHTTHSAHNTQCTQHTVHTVHTASKAARSHFHDFSHIHRLEYSHNPARSRTKVTFVTSATHTPPNQRATSSASHLMNRELHGHRKTWFSLQCFTKTDEACWKHRSIRSENRPDEIFI